MSTLLCVCLITDYIMGQSYNVVICLYLLRLQPSVIDSLQSHTKDMLQLDT